MTYWDRFEASKAYLPPGTKDLAYVQQALDDDWTLPERDYQKLSSDLLLFGDLVQKPLSQLPAAFEWLEARIELLRKADQSFRLDRWIDLSQSLTGSLALAGLATHKVVPKLEPTSDWRWLCWRVPKDERLWLNRLLTFSFSMKISPAEINETVMDAFVTSLRDGTNIRFPATTVNRTIQCWNDLSEKYVEWPKVKLRSRDSRVRYNIDRNQLPSPFWKEVNGLVSCMRDLDPYSPGWPRKPLSEQSTEAYRATCFEIASALVLSGFPADEVLGLRTIALPSNLKRAMNYLANRGSISSDTLMKTATSIGAIAKHYLQFDEEQLSEIALVKRYFRKSKDNLSERSRNLLRQFDNPSNVDRLFTLPEKLMLKASQQTKTPMKRGLLAQIAAAVEILLMCPLHATNLATLNVDRHFSKRSDDVPDFSRMMIPRQEVSNNIDLEFALSGQSVELIERYWKDYLPLLSNHRSSWVFPDSSGQRPKRPDFFSTQIRSNIYHHTRLRVHVSLFRLLAAKLYLSENPNSHEVVRRLLGLKHLESVTVGYSLFHDEEAALRFDEKILNRKPTQLS